MKIAHFADVHISTSKIEEFKVVLKQLTNKIKEQNPDLIIFSGDLFISRDQLSPAQVELARIFFKNYLAGYKILAIPGNHDSTNNEKKIDSISAIFTEDNKIKIYNKIGEYIDIENFRFHFFPYPSKSELIRLEINNLNQFLNHEFLLKQFELSNTKKNILVFHGTMEDFSVNDSYRASQSEINIGKDLVIPSLFYNKFDAVMAGHLHKFQIKNNAVYSGCPMPLTFADSDPTGFVVWDNLIPTFVELPQLYPYITIDLGVFNDNLINEIINKLKIYENKDFINQRIRIIYTINQKQIGEVDHRVIADIFDNALDIKIVPKFIDVKNSKNDFSFDSFKSHNIQDIIYEYIDNHKYNPAVKKIAESVENRLKNKKNEDKEGIDFKLDTLEISNFRSFGKKIPKINFNKLNNLIGVFGKNKIGKSSLVESIVWALFSVPVRNNLVSSVIRTGEEECKVNLEFESHKIKYRIERKRSLSKGSLLFFKYSEDLNKWVDISDGDIIETQKHINSLVGSFDIFISTIFSSQNDVASVIDKRPSERKQIILDCLQIDVIAKRANEIFEIRKELKNKLQLMRGKHSAYLEQLTELINIKSEEMLLQFKELLKNEKVLQNSYVESIESLSKKVYNYGELQKENDEINIEHNDLMNDYKNLKNKIQSKLDEKIKLEKIMENQSVISEGLERQRNIQEKIQKYADELMRNQERKSQISKINVTINSRKKDHKDILDTMENSRKLIIKQIDNLKFLDCPKPDCPLNSKVQEKKDELRITLDKINESINEKIKEHEIEINRIKEQVISIETIIETSFYDGKAHMKLVSNFEQEKQNKWEDLEKQTSSGFNVIQNIMELIAAYRKQRDDIDKRQSILIQKRSEIANRIAKITKYKNEIDNYKLSLKETNEKINRYEANIYKHEKVLEDISKLEKIIDELKDKILNSESYSIYCDKYSEVVGNTGVVYTIVDKALPIMEKFAQDLLSKTTNGALSLMLSSKKTLVSGKTKDEISIFIIDNKGKRDIAEASGAEKVLISLVLRAAMAYLLSLRMGSAVKLFIVDEGVGVLDSENIIVVKHIFTLLSEIFNKIILITHIEELKDIAQNIIEVISENKVSTYKILGNENE